MFELHRSIKHLNEGFADWSKAFLLTEKEIGAYRLEGNFVFLYGKRNQYGAAFVIEKDGGKYNVLALKDNKAINSGIVIMANNANFPSSKVMDFILKQARDREYLKKYTPSMSGKDLAKFLLQKEGMRPESFKDIFPEIKTDENLGKTDISGLNILGLEQFKEKDQARIADCIERAAGIAKKSGFGHLVYGDVYLVGKMRSGVQADYAPDSDQVRFKVESRSSDEYITRAFLHELGHRQYHKFRLDTGELNKKWFEVQGQEPGFELGTVFIPPKSQRAVVVDTIKHKRTGHYDYSGYYEDDPKKARLTIPYQMAASPDIKILKGKRPDVHKFRVTSYAMTNPSEFWAEVFSFALMGDKELMTWVKKVAK